VKSAGAIFSTVASPAVLYFPHYLTRHDFGGGGGGGWLGQKKGGLIFFARLFETLDI